MVNGFLVGSSGRNLVYFPPKIVPPDSFHSSMFFFFDILSLSLAGRHGVVSVRLRSSSSCGRRTPLAVFEPLIFQLERGLSNFRGGYSDETVWRDSRQVAKPISLKNQRFLSFERCFSLKFGSHSLSNHIFFKKFLPMKMYSPS